MNSSLRRLILRVSAALCTVVAVGSAQGWEYPPPGGKGRVVVAVSGAGGSQRYISAAKRLAGLGYDVILLDGNSFRANTAAGLSQAIAEAPQSEHALPGKVGVVGFSLGGGQVLTYATRWADRVAVVVAMFPKTSNVADVPAYVAEFKVPTLMLAGEADTYLDCCRIDKARAIASAATAASAPFQLVTYPGVGHDFVVRGRFFDGNASADAWQKTDAMLKRYLPPN